MCSWFANMAQTCSPNLLFIICFQDGFNPIMLAAKAGHARIVRLLKRDWDQEEPTEEMLVSHCQS